MKAFHALIKGSKESPICRKVKAVTFPSVTKYGNDHKELFLHRVRKYLLFLKMIGAMHKQIGKP